MKKSIKKNYLYNVTYQILCIILPIITTPYLARTLGPNGTGIYGYTISITTYFVLFGSLGISLYGQREIAYNQNDINKRSKVFLELFVFRMITMSLAMILFFFFFCLKGQYHLYYRILTLELVSNIFDISWFYQGIEEFKKVVVRNSFIKFVNIILIFLLINGPEDTGLYLIIYVMSGLLGNLSMWLQLRKYVVFQKVKIKTIFKYLLPILALFIPQIAVQIYTVLDKTMIGLILKNMSEVGFYEQAQKIVKITLTLVTSLGIVMVPRIASLYKKNDRNQINMYMKKVFNFVWFLGTPLLFGIIGIAQKFVPWFFGPGYNKVVILMICLSPIVYAIGFNNIIGVQYLIPTGKQKIFTISVSIGALTNFILNFILINFVGSVGACISTVLAETFILIYQIFYVYKNKDFDIKSLYKGSSKYIVSGIIMMILVYLTGLPFKATILTTFIQIFVGFVVYLLLMFIFKDKFFLEYYNSLKKQLLVRCKKCH